MEPPRRKAIALAALLVASVLASGCGGGDGGEIEDVSGLLADAPPPLAGLYEQGDALLGGGRDAFERRLAKLARERYPVVVNKWASWCFPCREEFPILVSQAGRWGTEVAFLGVNANDSEAAAETFLADRPVPYPSYSDPDESIADSLDTGRGYPATVFFDASGDQVHIKYGPYLDESELAADIRRWALGR